MQNQYTDIGDLRRGDLEQLMKTEVKERPILFSAPMIRALLDGRKTQTRRVVAVSNSHRQASPDNFPFDLERAWVDSGFSVNGGKHEYLHVAFRHPEEWREANPTNDTFERWHCRFYPGDRLWVRETWSMYRERTEPEQDRIDAITGKFFEGEYATMSEAAAELATVSRTGHPRAVYAADFDDAMRKELSPWKPSIFMPRWASRITLEITGVRVERVQEISEDDARAEGVTPLPIDVQPGHAYRECFHDLWDTLNQKRGYGWESNPWVWCLTFKRIEV